MTASQTYSTIVYTKIELQGSVYVATSTTLKGLLVVSKDKTLLQEKLIPDAIADLYAACGVKMVVTPLGSEMAEEWVATPISAIKAKADLSPAA